MSTEKPPNLVLAALLTLASLTTGCQCDNNEAEVGEETAEAPAEGAAEAPAEEAAEAAPATNLANVTVAGFLAGLREHGLEPGACTPKGHELIGGTASCMTQIEGGPIEIYQWDPEADTAKVWINRLRTEGYMGTRFVIRGGIGLPMTPTHPNWVKVMAVLNGQPPAAAPAQPPAAE